MYTLSHQMWKSILIFSLHLYDKSFQLVPKKVFILMFKSQNLIWHFFVRRNANFFNNSCFPHYKSSGKITDTFS